MDDMQAIIEQCRKNFGAAPRTLTPRERCDYLALPLTRWLREHPQDTIWEIYRAKETLLERGRIVWGFIVQANELLFRPGKLDCPAMAIYCPEPGCDHNLPELNRLAAQLFALKGSKPAEKELAHFAAVITNEMDRSMRVAIPQKLTGGRTVYSTTMMVYRKHLPNRMLSQHYFPLIIHPEATPCTIMLPFQYWPEVLQKIWVGEVQEPFLVKRNKL